MRIHADFSARAIVTPSADHWVRSPESGVDRCMLDRIGDEVARATTIVRYAPGSSFPRHLHPQGEEFLVLEGIFSDEHGDYPAGTYVRNPPGSGHSPKSADGCRILVKLRQFNADDLTAVVIDTLAPQVWTTDKPSGGECLRLHRFGAEEVTLLRLAAVGKSVTFDVGHGGLEWLLVSGSIHFENSKYPAESWFRFPAGDAFELNVIDDCVIWQKTGHLTVA